MLVNSLVDIHQLRVFVKKGHDLLEGKDSTARVSINGRNVTSATLMNLLEEEIEPLKVENGKIVVSMKARSFATVGFKLK